MKAVVFHGVGDIRLEEVAEPRIEAPTDALVQLTASAICGTDLHFVRGTVPGLEPGTILGHGGSFPIGRAMNKNLTIQMGNCNHRRYIPALLEMVRRGEIDPTEILTESKPLDSAIEAYEALDTHVEGWIKVELEPTDTDVGFH